jgi:hypothetical protein
MELDLINSKEYKMYMYIEHILLQSVCQSICSSVVIPGYANIGAV